jgi:hypothetical protein
MVSKRVNMPRNADPGLVMEVEPVHGRLRGPCRWLGSVANDGGCLSLGYPWPRRH